MVYWPEYSLVSKAIYNKIVFACIQGFSDSNPSGCWCTRPNVGLCVRSKGITSDVVTVEQC